MVASISNPKYWKKLTDNLTCELDSGNFRTGCKNDINGISRDRELTLKTWSLIIMDNLMGSSSILVKD